MRAPTTFGIALLASVVAERSAWAGEPGDVVRLFYEQPGLELEASGREYFIDPARRVLELNNGILEAGEGGCIDPHLPFDDTDFDHDEVMRTLDIGEVAVADEATVVASFSAEGMQRRVQWRLKKVDGAWKISDMISMAKDWALSRFGCE